MRLLIANDDGIYSPGLATLARVARGFGEVRVVAPDVEQSSSSHSITSSKPLDYRRTRIIEGVEAYRVNGTPADCVALGAYHWESVDVVLSGVNLGPNLGNALWHSGTLAAAKQAALLGLRGIAFSTPVVGDDPDMSGLEPCLERVLDLLLPRRELKLVNVNLPPSPRGICWTRQAVEQYDGRVVPGEDPLGRRHFWFTVVPLERHQPGTDLWAQDAGYISMTPLRLDLTNHAELSRAAGDQPIIEFGDTPAAERVADDEMAGEGAADDGASAEDDGLVGDEDAPVAAQEVPSAARDDASAADDGASAAREDAPAADDGLVVRPSD